MHQLFIVSAAALLLSAAAAFAATRSAITRSKAPIQAAAASTPGLSQLKKPARLIV
jgi:hypothetical protein